MMFSLGNSVIINATSSGASVEELNGYGILMGGKLGKQLVRV